MSSRKQLKKEINNTLGALIKRVYVKNFHHLNWTAEKGKNHR